MTIACPPRPIVARHLADLRRSGLNDETIADSGIYTEADPATISRILQWESPARNLGPCMVIPYRHIDGTLNGFARIRPDHPRENGGKYESPFYRHEPKPDSRAYFTVSAIDAIKIALAMLMLTEGEKKALAASQAGIPCIGLAGVENWHKKRAGDGPDRLIDDLAAIDWTGRAIVICFDSDPRRNPNVNRCRAELAAVLTALGAHVVFLTLPLGPRGSDGMPGKMGIDDYIVAYGEESLRQLLQPVLTGDGPARSLEDYRAELAKNRLESVGTKAVYLDTSPTGSGKTTADVPALRMAGSSLTVLPTHKNCVEVEQAYIKNDLRAAAYPELSRKTCMQYGVAERVMGAGLSVSQTLCLSCSNRDACDYRMGMEEADAVPHAVTTHHRARLCMTNIAAGKAYVTIHEEPVDVLRPTEETAAGLDKVAEVSRAAKDRAWNRNDTAAREHLYHVENAAHLLLDALADAAITTPIIAGGEPTETTLW
jgi:hypothetical protein